MSTTSRSLVAVFSVSALGLVMAACSGAPEENTGSTQDELCLVTGKGCTAPVPTIKIDDPRDPKRPPRNPDGKGGKSTCKHIDAKGVFEFNDAYVGNIKFYGNTKLGKWEPKTGQVPCVHVDSFDPNAITVISPTASARMCEFKLDDNNNSPYDPMTGKGRTGAYVRDTSNNVYVPIGQRVESDGGKAGGLWVTGVRPDPIAPDDIPCLKPSGKDTAGTGASTDLAAECTREVAGASANFTGIPVKNYATREVCTTSNPHPDGAALKGPGSIAGTWCYVETGAAVNDTNGERDEHGTYFGTAESCHLVDSNGVQVPAGKRISTKSFPAPGVPNTKSPVTWLVVNSYVPIGN